MSRILEQTRSLLLPNIYPSSRRVMKDQGKATGDKAGAVQSKTKANPGGKTSENKTQQDKGKGKEKGQQIKRLGSLTHLISSSSEDEKETDKKEEKPIALLGKVASAHPDLIRDFAEINKAGKVLLPVMPKPESGTKANDALQALEPLITKSKL